MCPLVRKFKAYNRCAYNNMTFDQRNWKFVWATVVGLLTLGPTVFRNCYRPSFLIIAWKNENN